MREVRAYTLRAQRLEQDSRDRIRQIDHGLHLPLAPVAVPDRPAADAVRYAKTQAVSCQLSAISRYGFFVIFSRPAADRVSSCCRRLVQHRGFRRRSNLQLLRINHDPEWKLL